MLILMQTLGRGGEYIPIPGACKNSSRSYHTIAGSTRGQNANLLKAQEPTTVIVTGTMLFFHLEAFQRDRKSADDARAIERQTQSNKQIEGLTKSSPTNGITY